MQLNPESVNSQSFYDGESQSVPSDRNYFLIYPFSKSDLDHDPKKYKDERPCILTYSKESETLEDIIKVYHQISNMTIPQEKIILTLHSSRKLSRYFTLDAMKATLRRDNIDGLKLYVYINPFDFEDQCCILDLMKLENQFNANASQVRIELPDIKENVYIYIKPEDKVETLKEKTINEVQRIYGAKLKPEEIEFEYIDFNKSKAILEDKNIHFINSSSVKNSLMHLKISGNTKIAQKKIISPNKIIFKTGNNQSIEKVYEEMKERMVLDILMEIYLIKQKPEEYGLKIMDYVIKPKEKLKKIEKIFEHEKQFPKIIIAYLIQESHIFYDSMSNVDQPFQLQKLQIDEKNINHKQQCVMQTELRAKNTKNINFKNKKEKILPILLYTSSLKCKLEGNSGFKELYKGLNQKLRVQKFGLTEKEDIKKMQYVLSANLIKQLNTIQPVKIKVWRGVDYVINPRYKKGQIIEWKQFNSTSSKRDVVYTFNPTTIFEIQCFDGKPIKDFSFYQTQQEILLQPYSKFEVISHEFEQDKKDKNKKINIYKIKQIKIEPMKQSKAYFILWVDDKPLQGQDIWKSILKARQTTLLYQLISTKELQQWITRYKQVINSKHVQVIMITNMTRVEGGKKNQEAGIEAIKFFQKYCPNFPIFLYIGYVQGAMQKLEKHKIKLHPELLQISNQPSPLRSFLDKKCGLA